jgi:hypothetical protein
MALATTVLARPIVSLLALYATQPEHILIRIVVASKVNCLHNIFNALSRRSKVIYQSVSGQAHPTDLL